MQLTKFTDYCLRVLMYLAAREDEMATVSAVAQTYDVSHHHLTKVVQHLNGKGYVDTVRGKKGGIRLARKPQFINLGEVVRDCEQALNLVECFDTDYAGCPLLPSCALRAALKEATKSFFAALDRYSLADLVPRPRSGSAGKATIPIHRAA